MLLLKKRSHFYIVPFYFLDTCINMFWWKSKHQLFYTTNKILLKNYWALGGRAICSGTSSLPNYTMSQWLTFKVTEAPNAFTLLGHSFLCFHFPRTLLSGFSNLVHLVFLSTTIFILQKMKLTAGRLNKFPKD